MSDKCKYTLIGDYGCYPRVAYKSECGLEFVVLEGYNIGTSGERLKTLRMPTKTCVNCGKEIVLVTTKPAPVQSAEELAKKIVSTIDSQTRPLYCMGEWRHLITKNLIEADRAAQRQAGKDEIVKALNLAIDCMNENPSDEAIDAFKSDPLINRIVHILRQLSEAQRQAGREEAQTIINKLQKQVEIQQGWLNEDARKRMGIHQRYAALVEVARKANGILSRLASFIYKHDLARHYGLEKISKALHEALSDLERK